MYFLRCHINFGDVQGQDMKSTRGKTEAQKLLSFMLEVKILGCF